jgi:signal transduction histidine kinase
LGLSIVQAIADSHGGRAGAGNRRGGGADVWIAIPAVKAAADASARRVPPVSAS